MAKFDIDFNQPLTDALLLRRPHRSDWLAIAAIVAVIIGTALVVYGFETMRVRR